jgi:hypothetical protein
MDREGMKMPSWKVAGGVALLLLASLMGIGFLRSGLDPFAPATFFALLLVVVAPAAGGAALLWHAAGAGGRIAKRQEALRLRTLQSEIMRLAPRLGGKVTAVEVVSELAVDTKTAEAALHDLAVRELADVELAESGHMVYSFQRIQNLDDEKKRAKNVLDA